MSTIQQVIDRAQLIAMNESGMTSPIFDNDYIAELLYPLAMKKVILEAGQDPHKQKDVRISQNVTITAGVGAMPTNAVLECVETARVIWGGADITFNGNSGNASTDKLTAAAHGLQTGQQVKLGGFNGISVLTGLSLNRLYYIIKFDANTIGFASTRANAFAGTLEDITDTVGQGATLYVMGDADPASYVSKPADLNRPLYSEFSYWTVDSGSVYFTPSGDIQPRLFTGTVILNAVVFPIINSNNIQIVAGTDLAEDVIDDIVRELASAIRQEVAVKSIAA